MYVHLGSKKSVPERYIVGIFDLDGEVTPKITAEFLSAAERANIVTSAGDDIPRSFVLCADKKGEEVVLSHISAGTIGERASKQARADGQPGSPGGQKQVKFT